jgi:hypothetical protein
MPESLVMAYVEREFMCPPPQVSSRAKNKEFKETGKYTVVKTSQEVRKAKRAKKENAIRPEVSIVAEGRTLRSGKLCIHSYLNYSPANATRSLQMNGGTGSGATIVRLHHFQLHGGSHQPQFIKGVVGIYHS